MDYKKRESRKAEGKKRGFLNKLSDGADAKGLLGEGSGDSGSEDSVRMIHAMLIDYSQFERVVKEKFPNAKIKTTKYTALAVGLSEDHPGAFIKLDVNREEITHYGLSRIIPAWHGKNASIQLATLLGMDMTARQLEKGMSDLPN
jgi:hypothetical protein